MPAAAPGIRISVNVIRGQTDMSNTQKTYHDEICHLAARLDLTLVRLALGEYIPVARTTGASDHNLTAQGDDCPVGAK
jgi:hypothetical protein